RRRHTRFSRDWSSDVCSSDLVDETALGADADYTAALASGEALVFEPEPEDDEEEERRARARRAAHIEEGEPPHDPDREHERQIRSEERRVGKEARPGKIA